MIESSLTRTSGFNRTPPPDFRTLPDCALIKRRDLLTPRGPVPLSTMTVQRMIAAGKFPAPVKLSGLNTWRWGDVRQWLEAQGVAA